MADEKEKKDEPEKTEEDKPESAAAPKAAPSAKSGMLVMILVGFAVMIMTPLITFFLVKKTVAQPEQQQQAPPPPKTSEPSGLFDVGAVTVNIDNTQGTRYLRITAQLVVSPAKLSESLKEKTVLVKDRIISAVGNKSINDLEGQIGRENLKKDIMQRVNAAIADDMAGSVVDIYFSEYIIQ